MLRTIGIALVALAALSTCAPQTLADPPTDQATVQSKPPENPPAEPAPPPDARPDGQPPRDGPPERGERERDGRPPLRPGGPRGDFRGGPPGGPDGDMGPLGPDPLLRAIRERNPELAQRLERLRHDDPRRFNDIMVNAVLLNIEDQLSATERADRQEHDAAAGGPGERADRPEARRVAELQGEQEQLEQHSRELAQRLRALRDKPDAGDEIEAVRAELQKAVERQFEVRTALRELEVQRIERELQDLQRVVTRMREELKHRWELRDRIIHQRMEDLLRRDGAGW